MSATGWETRDSVFYELGLRGFPYDPKTTSIAVYLSTCLGQPEAWRIMPVTMMMAALNSKLGGKRLSHKTTSLEGLLDALNGTLKTKPAPKRRNAK